MPYQKRYKSPVIVVISSKHLLSDLQLICTIHIKLLNLFLTFSNGDNRKRRRRQPNRAAPQSCAIYGDLSVSMRKGHMTGDPHAHYHTYVPKDSQIISKQEEGCEDYIYSRQMSPQSGENDVTNTGPPPVQYSIHSPNPLCKSHWQQTLGTRGLQCSCDKHSCPQPDVTYKSFNHDPLMYFELEPSNNDTSYYSVRKHSDGETERVDEESRTADSAVKSV